MNLTSLCAAAAEHAPEPTLWIDMKGQLLHANAAAEQVLGWTRSELAAKTVFDIAPDLDEALWKQLWRDVRRQSLFRVEIMLNTSAGRSFPAEVQVHALSVDSKEYVCAYFHDIAETKRLHELKNEFISTVSHELRTPMTIIREGVSQVMEGVRGDLTPEQRRALSISLTGIDRLRRIINDVLDISKIESGKLVLRREWVNLSGLLQEVAATFQSRGIEKGLSLRVEAARAVRVFADHDKIFQVVTNLVANALKFTSQGQVTLSVSEKEDHAQCQVTDTGIGIAPEHLGRVFDKFEQIGSEPVTGEKGTGLGLSICKGIIELHQGRIWATSGLGKGSVFAFSLPKVGPAEVFRLRLMEPLREALQNQGSVTCIFWRVAGTATHPAIDSLEQLLLIHSGRRSDIVVKDSDHLYVGMLGMVRKEAQRIITPVETAFQDLAKPGGTLQGVTLERRVIYWPEETTHERDLFKRLFNGD